MTFPDEPILRRRRSTASWLAWLLASLLAAMAVRAAESAGSPVPNEDSIAAAKRQLDALRADANASKAGTDAARAPVIVMPELHPTTEDSAPVASPALAKPNASDKRKANWLVDAMMKPKETSRNPRDPQRREIDANESKLRHELDLFGADEKHAGDASEPATNLEPTTQPVSSPPPAPPPGFNPFSRFMSDWLAPQDYAMLRRTADMADTTASALSSQSLPSSPGSGDAALASALANFGVSPSDATKRDYGSPPIENPYLQPLALPEVTPATTMPAPLFAPAPEAVSTLTAPPPPETSQKPAAPDFVKPAMDDKYFKPLKRF